MEGQKLGSSLKPRPKFIQRGVAKEQAAQTVRCGAVQDGVEECPESMAAGATKRILDSSNSEKIEFNRRP